MRKRAPKTTKTDQKIVAAELAAQREKATLRRHRDQQRQIRQLAKQLIRAITHADAARIELARAITEGTGWAVFDEEQIKADQREREMLGIANRKLSKKLEELNAPAAAADAIRAAATAPADA